ncbi:hypothetical protein [Haloarchaeobius sp. HRN-SO-5]|uniref:hypothetical protein n=1 Tax=Haloarchaeobius sp. HRN-SO-5 TaxID=3446118 RepID=UPI003EBE3E74
MYRTPDETVFVITPTGDVEFRQSVQNRGVDAWMEHTREARGWTSQEYYTTLGRALAANIEVQD